MLIGHSMGAGVLEATRPSSELVKSVFLVDTHWAFVRRLQSIVDQPSPACGGKNTLPVAHQWDHKMLPDVTVGPPVRAIAAEWYASLRRWTGQAVLQRCPVHVYAVFADQHW